MSGAMATAPAARAEPAPLRIDHIAYLVRDTDRTLAALGFLRSDVPLHREPLSIQAAFISFVEPGGGAPRIELVEPFEDNRAMHRRLDREGMDSILYHVGYFAVDFDLRYAAMRAEGWMPLTLPFEGMMPGRRASHLLHPDLGIVEIMEAGA